MRAFQIFSIVLGLHIIYGYIPKENRVTNNTSKTDKQLCAERGHQFDEDSTDITIVDFRVEGVIVSY